MHDIRMWFLHYVSSFGTGDPALDQNYSLKRLHTDRVVFNIIRIAEDEGMEGNALHVAEAAGLLHDVGRFPQFRDYGTFSDAGSVNHGALGAEVLESQGVLKACSGRERFLIMNAVRYHNAFGLPGIDDDEALLYLRLIRDADKLDIWWVFAEYFEAPAGTRNPVICNNLPESEGYSESLMAELLAGRSPSLHAARNLNDYKLVQLAWAYGLHFRAACAMLYKMKHIERIALTLPRTPEVATATERVLRHIADRASGAVI